MRRLLLALLVALIPAEALACRASSALEAVERCTDALSQPGLSGPERAKLLETRGVAHFLSDDMASAMVDLAESLAINPDPEVFAKRALMHANADNHGAASRDIETALSMDPENPFILKAQADVLIRQRRLEEALEVLTRAKQRGGPWMPQILRSRGFLLLKLDRADEALLDFKALEGFPNQLVWARLGRARALVALGDEEEALWVMDALVAERPDDALALVARAHLKVRLGQLEAAELDLDDALALDPESGNAFNLRSLVRCRMGDREGALADSAEAIRRDAYPSTSMQRQLREAGYYAGPSSGSFDPETLASIEAYIRDRCPEPPRF